MKTLHVIIREFTRFLGLGTYKKTPQLIAVIKKISINVAITDDCCENNLFI
jgi:hypothetical protein